MGHRLVPSERSPRTLAELVSLLRSEFPIVEADRDKGGDHIGDMITHFLKMKDGFARSKKAPPNVSQIDAIIEELQQQRGNAAYVTVADDEFDEDRCVTFNLVPGEDLIIGYANKKHQDVATTITERIAAVIGYELTPL